MRPSQKVIDEFISSLEPKPLEGGDYDKNLSVAYHEAGHAVIKLIYGQWPNHVTIIPEDELLGYVVEWDEYDLGPDRFFTADPDGFNILLDSDISIRYDLSSSFGGVIAEAIYTREYNWDDARTDLERVLYKLASISSILDYDLAKEVFHETHDYILAEWQTVQKVAEDLSTRKTLNKEYFYHKIAWGKIRKYHDE